MGSKARTKVRVKGKTPTQLTPLSPTQRALPRSPSSKLRLQQPKETDGDAPEYLEAKLRELQAAPTQEGRTPTYGQAKEDARRAKTALERQSLKVVSLQMVLDDEISKLQAADLELVRTEKVERELLAKDVQHKNNASSIARAAQDGTAEVDVSALLPALDDPHLTEAGKQSLGALEASLKAAVASWGLASRQQQQQMYVDLANRPKRKSDELGAEAPEQGGANNAAQLDLDNPVGGLPSAPSDPAAAVDPNGQARGQQNANTTPSKEGGKAAPQTGTQQTQATREQKAASAKEAAKQARLAELLASTRSATLQAVAVAEAEARDKAVEYDIFDNHQDSSASP